MSYNVYKVRARGMPGPGLSDEERADFSEKVDAAAASAALAESASGPTYTSVAAGEAATTVGHSFAVSNGDGTVTVYLRTSGGSAVQRTLATTAALASAGGAALIGFTDGGADAISRPVQDKLRETISVKDFGAKGDGVTDDTTAIQKALNRAALLKATVVFPDGVYLHSARLLVKNGTRGVIGKRCVQATAVQGMSSPTALAE